MTVEKDIYNIIKNNSLHYILTIKQVKSKKVNWSVIKTYEIIKFNILRFFLGIVNQLAYFYDKKLDIIGRNNLVIINYVI